MKKEYYIELIYKSFAASLSAEEQRQLDEWLATSAQHRAELEAIQKMWSLSADFSKDLVVDLDKDFAVLQKKIGILPQKNKADATVRSLPTEQRRSWWKPLSVAAAVILLAGVFYFLQPNQNSSVPNLVLETKEEVKKILLADGTQVWLNKNTSLKYPETMDGKERNVTLTGEAFFEVAENPDQPFIISTNEVSVKVLGTSFEVNAPSDEAFTIVTVKSGKVAMTANEGNAEVILTANQKGTYSKSKRKIATSTVKNLNTISWQNQVLDFNDVTLEKALSDIEAHFDIKLTLGNTDLLKCGFTSIFINPKQEKTLTTICDVFKMKLVSVSEKSFRLEGGECQIKKNSSSEGE
ncbi:MAG: FecR domain-containing protein [Bacteroidota bacterium]